MTWSATNATEAYLRTLKTGNKASEPDVAGFISAMAAGNCSRLMVEVCAGTAGATTLALIAAAHQTGGRVVCILRGHDELHSSEIELGAEAAGVELVVGDARTLLLNNYKGADFVLVDCELEEHERVFRAAQAGAAAGQGGVVVGCHAFGRGSWGGGPRVDLLPIGDGLQVSRVPPAAAVKRSHWVVRVDECTGEEHAFRITTPRRKWIET